MTILKFNEPMRPKIGDPISDGIQFPIIMKHFDETFSASGHQYFSNFLQAHSEFDKWMIYSDYVVQDDHKPNDVISLVILPYCFDLNGFMALIDSLQKKDIKSSRSINPQFIEFIKNAPVFYINVILSKKRSLGMGIQNDKDTLGNIFDGALNSLRLWLKNEPHNEDVYLNEIKDLSLIRDELQKKSPSLRVLKDIVIVANIVSYILKAMHSVLNSISLIGWFSDRDALLTYRKTSLTNPLIGTMISHYFHALCEHDTKNTKRPKITFGLPNDSGKMWYDSCVRLADVVCGTLADYDFKNDRLSHSKFTELMREIIANPDKSLTFEMSIPKKGKMETKRIVFSKKTEPGHGPYRGNAD